MSRYLKTSADSISKINQSTVKLIDDKHSRRRSEQETRTQGEASRKVLLRGLKRTINQQKDLNGTVLEIAIRVMKIPIPYLTEDAEAMRRQGHLDILLKVDFVEYQPSSTLYASDAQRCDQAYHLRIRCTYVLKKGEGMYRRELWVTQGPETPT